MCRVSTPAFVVLKPLSAVHLLAEYIILHDWLLAILSLVYYRTSIIHSLSVNEFLNTPYYILM